MNKISEGAKLRKKMVRAALPGLDHSTQQASQPDADPGLVVVPVQVGAYQVHPEQLENILQSPENFHVVVIPIDIEGIGASYQVPVQALEQRDLIGEEAVEMVLDMTGSIKVSRRTVGVIRGELEAVEILAGYDGLVAIEMLIVLDKDRVGI